MSDFRCEDIILECQAPNALYNGTMCCEKIFNTPVDTLMGRCYSTHGHKIFQNFPGATQALYVTAKTLDARK